VGKTHLAIEYARRHANEYDLVAWLPAEQPHLLRAAYQRLAERMGLPATDDATRAVGSVLDTLRRGGPYRRWLLIFDNAEEPAALRDYLPGHPSGRTSGRVLVTSRDRTWSQVADMIEVDVLHRGESVTLLRQRLPDADESDADRLADQLGDLPLALEQAAAWISDTGDSIADYLTLLEERLRDLLQANQPVGYSSSVAATFDLSLRALADLDPGAAELFELCAFFGPEPISRDLLRLPPGRVGIPPALESTLSDGFALRTALARIRRRSMATIDAERQTIQLHRLMQAFVRAWLPDSVAVQLRDLAQQILVAVTADASPMDSLQDRALLGLVEPHFVAAGCIDSPDPAVRQVVVEQARHWFRRGDPVACRDLCTDVVARWTATLGPDDEQVWAVRSRLGDALRWMGEIGPAHAIAEDVYDRAQRVHGPRHVVTVSLASSFASDLRIAGDYDRARELDTTILTEYEAAYGPEHVRCLGPRHNLAIDLRFLGRFTDALAVDERNVEVCQTLLDPEHWWSLFAQASVAYNHYYLGDYRRALALLDDALPKMKLVHNREYTLPTWERLHAITLLAAGFRDQADAVGQAALAAYHVTFGKTFMETAMMTMSLANIARPADPGGAASLAAEALDDHVRLLGPDHPTTACAMSNAANAFRAAGRRREAAEQSRQAYLFLADHLGADHWATLAAQINHASDLAAAGEYSAAVRTGRGAHERMVDARGPGHPHTLVCAHNLSLDLRAGGHGREAQDLGHSTLDGLADRFGPDHPFAAAARRRRRLDCDIEVTTF
jgi:hypothetical protein